jgi:hypothetical protein
MKKCPKNRNTIQTYPTRMIRGVRSVKRMSVARQNTKAFHILLLVFLGAILIGVSHVTPKFS